MAELKPYPLCSQCKTGKKVEELNRECYFLEMFDLKKTQKPCPYFEKIKENDNATY